MAWSFIQLVDSVSLSLVMSRREISPAVFSVETIRRR